MTAPHYNPARYVVRMMDGNPAIFDAVDNVWHKFGRMSWAETYRMADEWNAGKLTPTEAHTIAEHFLIAAAWAEAPEGTRPRPTENAREYARALAREIVGALGVPLFRACLDEYEAEGLHPDCNGDACAAFGHDLYLTLAGHGTGFWDREALAWDHDPEERARLGLAKGQTIGERITEHCHASRWRDVHGLEFYRGWIYLHALTRPANT